MPHYPSNLNNPALVYDNVTAYIEIKDPIDDDPADNGEYPTDAAVGMDLNPSPTTVFDDLQGVLNNLSNEIDALYQAIDDLETAGPLLVGLASNADLIRIREVMQNGLELTFVVNRLSTIFNEHLTAGALGTSLYPSGQNRGY